jgi:hypothetical protein
MSKSTLHAFVVVLFASGLAGAPAAFAQAPPVPPAPPPPPEIQQPPARPEAPPPAPAGAGETGPWMEIYGFAMTDIGYNFKQIDPAWFDTMRPTKLPSVENEFGKDGQTYAGVRQTRFGVKSELPTSYGVMKTIFEFEMFGVGIDAGQTTFRLRHAYGELGHFGAGQTWSPFMDIDVFPNSLEYWGPNGMPFFRNVQVRWMPIQGDTRLTFALERPGATADGGIYADRVELEDIKPRFPMPDISGEYRLAGKPGYVKLAGIVRWIKWDDVGADAFDLSGSAIGWGATLSSNVNLGKHILKLQAVYGHGIENYMNDAPADIAPKLNPGNATTPFKGVALPVLGVVAFIDLTWSERFSSSLGYSLVKIWNSDGQAPSAFKMGQYGLVNLLCTPTKNVMGGVEFQFGRRDNFDDGWSVNDFKVQFSFRYKFSYELGGKKS